jgi:hypothetical protein
MRRGFLYLVAIMDRHSRKVLSWSLSNTLEVVSAYLQRNTAFRATLFSFNLL